MWLEINILYNSKTMMIKWEAIFRKNANEAYRRLKIAWTINKKRVV